MTICTVLAAVAFAPLPAVACPVTSRLASGRRSASAQLARHDADLVRPHSLPAVPFEKDGSPEILGQSDAEIVSASFLSRPCVVGNARRCVGAAINALDRMNSFPNDTADFLLGVC
jgi:hypothetical protein